MRKRGLSFLIRLSVLILLRKSEAKYERNPAMCKRISVAIIALLMAFMLVGCKAKESKPTFEIMPDDDSNTISITVTS